MNPIPLVCLPFAGAGASFYYPWSESAGEEIQVMAVQPPGREWRFTEEPYRDVTAAADGLFPEIAEELDGGNECGPVILFGHSMGAVLAYELARRLCSEPGIEVTRLIVSGSPGPWTRRTPRATGLPDDEFLDQVSEFAEYNAETLQNPELRELILPTLRADVEMHEKYLPVENDPLPVPITSLRGSDDQLVTAEGAAEWATATSREFELVNLAGGHMYLVHDADPILRIAQDEARTWQGAHGQPAPAG
jgi:surfactin synthase thioesterase subunit